MAFAFAIEVPETVYAAGSFARPVYSDAVITQSFGTGHPGIDYAVYGNLQFPVLAADSGTVTESNGYNCKDNADSNSNPPCYNYGNFMVITHPSGYKTYYAHLVRGSLLPYGTTVTRGQQIAVADDTGKSTANHLHFEVRNSNNVQVNPSDPNNCLWITCPTGAGPALPSVRIIPPPSTADGNGNAKTDFRPGDAIKINVSIKNTSASKLSFTASWIPRDQNGNQISAPSYSGTLTQDANSTWGWSLLGTIPTNLPAGTYTYKITANYNKVTFGVVTFTVSGTPPPGCSSIPSNQFCGEYYSNRYLTPPATFVRNDISINNDWGTSGPGNGLGNDNFSIRWQGSFYFDAATYKFTTTSDDGIKLWVDGGTPLIDKWFDQGPTTYTATRTMSAGYHTVKVEYYENGGGAVAKASWQKDVISCSNQYKAEYWNNKNYSGSPVLVRCENWPINWDWGGGGPGGGVPNDGFAARWTGTAYINSGNYTFIAVTDDGMKVWLDNNLIIDKWYDQGPTEHRVTKYVSAGNHNIRVDYYENGGGATAKFRWEPAPSTNLINGNFESGRNVGWSEYSSGGVPIVQTGFPHTGSWSAYFCWYNNCTEHITQPFMYSSGKYLSFWSYVKSEEPSSTTAYDYLRVELLSSSGTLLTTLTTRSNTSPRNGWVQTLVSLPSGYAGQNVTMRFRATNDGSYRTAFYVDDVSIQ
jgi:hypothetical protein